MADRGPLVLPSCHYSGLFGRTSGWLRLVCSAAGAFENGRAPAEAALLIPQQRDPTYRPSTPVKKDRVSLKI
jgi:hypothetical protein